MYVGITYITIKSKGLQLTAKEIILLRILNYLALIQIYTSCTDTKYVNINTFIFLK